VLVYRHTTSGKGLEPDVSGAVCMHGELRVRIVCRALMNTVISDLNGRRGVIEAEAGTSSPNRWSQFRVWLALIWSALGACAEGHAAGGEQRYHVSSSDFYAK
jgi:hypothetical protein